MSSPYILRSGVATVSDLKDGNSVINNIGDGEVFYVDPGNGSDAEDGATAATAFATMQTAVDACVAGRGDLILRLPGGEEVTTAVLFNKAGIYVKAVTYGVNPLASGELFSTYSASAFTDGPAANVTSRCTLDGLGFVSRDAGATFYDGAALLIGTAGLATPFGTHIVNCRFPKWNFTNRIGLAIEGSADVLVEHCDFEGVGSAFASGIYVQGAAQNITIRHNHFKQCTSAITFGAFAGGGPHCFVYDNYVEDGKILTAASAATGIIAGNWSEAVTGDSSFGNTIAALKAFGLNPSSNNYVDADT